MKRSMPRSSPIRHEIPARPADDARQRCRRPRPVDRVVQDCRHRVEPDPAEMAQRYGAESSTVATVTPYRGPCTLTYPTKKPTRSRKSYTPSSRATRYPLSPRIQALRAIPGKLRPEPVREPLPPLKH